MENPVGLSSVRLEARRVTKSVACQTLYSDLPLSASRFEASNHADSAPLQTVHETTGRQPTKRRMGWHGTENDAGSPPLHTQGSLRHFLPQPVDTQAPGCDNERL